MNEYSSGSLGHSFIRSLTHSLIHLFIQFSLLLRLLLRLRLVVNFVSMFVQVSLLPPPSVKSPRCAGGRCCQLIEKLCAFACLQSGQQQKETEEGIAVVVVVVLCCIVRLGCSSEDCPLVSSQQSMPRQSRLRFAALIDILIDIIYESVNVCCTAGCQLV